jgi:hypothetical protein
MNNCFRMISRSFLLGAISTILAAATMGEFAPRIFAQQNEREAEKRFAMHFEKAPWAKVFETYSDQTGLTFISRFPLPPGTFSYSTPKGETYTRHEAAMIINESLMKEGFVLVPRKLSTTMLKIAKN